ncbi:MAG: hypothetical protein RI953_1720 [Pseudomonadota bacterium]|jgi:nitrite reductase/ring-hydroxylating ferredoxin subunit
MPTFFPAVSLSQIDDKKITKCVVDGLSVLITRGANGTVYAFENNCSHADKPLERGVWNPATLEMLCPFHKAVFDVGQGGAVKVGPAVVSLVVYPVEVRSHNDVDTVFVGLDVED